MKTKETINMTSTYVVGNFKGGVGKTKIVTMLAFDNAFIKNKKTLVLDMDPQGNASQTLARTGNIEHIDKTITDGIQEMSLKNCITPIMKNLDLIACDTSFRSFTKFVIKSYESEKDQVSVIKNLLEPIKEEYDTIFIDVPPTISEYSDNAMVAADYSIIAFQTQEESFEGVRKYIGYQNFMVERYNIDLQVIGIIACMLKPDSSIDNKIMNEAKEEYNDAVLDTVVTYQERLKGYSTDGIHLFVHKNGNYDQWDFKAHSVFINLLNEIEARTQFLLEGTD